MRLLKQAPPCNVGEVIYLPVDTAQDYRLKGIAEPVDPKALPAPPAAAEDEEPKA